MARILRSARSPLIQRRRRQPLIFVGATWHHNDNTTTAQNDYQLSINGIGGADPTEWVPNGSEAPQPGDTALLLHCGNGTSDFSLVAGFVDLFADDVPRISVTVGENCRTAVKTKALTEADLTAGYIVIEPSVRANQDAAILVFRNVVGFVGAGTTNTASSLNASQVAIRQETMPAAGFVLPIFWRGGGTRNASLAGFTQVVNSQHTSSSGAGAYALGAFLAEAGAGTSPSGTIDVDGADNLSLRTWTIGVH